MDKAAGVQIRRGFNSATNRPSGGAISGTFEPRLVQFGLKVVY